MNQAEAGVEIMAVPRRAAKVSRTRFMVESPCQKTVVKRRQSKLDAKYAFLPIWLVNGCLEVALL